MAATTKISVNGAVHSVIVNGDRSLLSVLREELNLTGAHYGCGEGQCGACTVLVDGKAVRSCITPLASIGKRAVVTIGNYSASQLAVQVHSQSNARASLVQCRRANAGYNRDRRIIGASKARYSAWFSVVQFLIGVSSVCESRQQNPFWKISTLCDGMYPALLRKQRKQ